MTMKLIVAGSDFSPAAAAATRRAARIAADAGARLAILHVAPHRPAWTRIGAATPAVVLLRREATRIRAEYGIAVDPYMAKGAPHKEIAAFARASNADLVVLGLQGGFVQDFLGTGIAQRLRRRLDIPVLAVASEPRGSYGRILVATDFSPESAYAAKIAAHVFPGVALHLLHICRPVTGPAREAQRHRAILQAARELSDFARRNGLGRAALNVRMGSAAAGIRERAREIGADLVVIAPAAKSWLEKLIFFSVTDTLLSHAERDALLIEPGVRAPAASLQERTSS